MLEVLFSTQELAGYLDTRGNAFQFPWGSKKMPISGFGQSQQASSVGLLQRGDSCRKGQQVHKDSVNLTETPQDSNAESLGMGLSGLWNFG